MVLLQGFINCTAVSSDVSWEWGTSLYKRCSYIIHGIMYTIDFQNNITISNVDKQTYLTH